MCDGRRRVTQIGQGDNTIWMTRSCDQENVQYYICSSCCFAIPGGFAKMFLSKLTAFC